MNLDDIVDDLGYESASDESVSNESESDESGAEVGDEGRNQSERGKEKDERKLRKQNFDDIELEWVQSEREREKVCLPSGSVVPLFSRKLVIVVLV
jgi:hypothetical protein